MTAKGGGPWLAIASVALLVALVALVLGAGLLIQEIYRPKPAAIAAASGPIAPSPAPPPSAATVASAEAAASHASPSASPHAEDDEPSGDGLHVTYDHVTEHFYTDAQIRTLFQQHARELRVCYAKALVVAPTLEGELEAAVVINANGSTSAVNAGISYRHDDYEFRQCVDRTMETWEFPPTAGAKSGIFTIVGHVHR